MWGINYAGDEDEFRAFYALGSELDYALYLI